MKEKERDLQSTNNDYIKVQYDSEDYIKHSKLLEHWVCTDAGTLSLPFGYCHTASLVAFIALHP